MKNTYRAALLLAIVLFPLMASACGGQQESLDQGSPSARSAVTSGEPEADASAPVANVVTDRKIIQTASMSLQVKAVSEAFQEVTRTADAAGGFVSSSSFSNEGESQVASITIRVPAARFQETLASLRALAVKVENEQSQANDVTEEYTDLGARLRNLQATEAQYIEFLKQAKDIGEVLQVQDRLNAVRADIEQAQGRINLLDNLADMSTITVHLSPEAAADSGGGGPNPAEAAKAAWDASLTTLRGLATGIVAVAAFSWWLVPIFILLALVGRKLSPRRKE